jgi:hypothetical protein
MYPSRGLMLLGMISLESNFVSCRDVVKKLQLLQNEIFYQQRGYMTGTRADTSFAAKSPAGGETTGRRDAMNWRDVSPVKFRAWQRIELLDTVRNKSIPGLRIEGRRLSRGDWGDGLRGPTRP